MYKGSHIGVTHNGDTALPVCIFTMSTNKYSNATIVIILCMYHISFIIFHLEILMYDDGKNHSIATPLNLVGAAI